MTDPPSATVTLLKRIKASDHRRWPACSSDTATAYGMLSGMDARLDGGSMPRTCFRTVSFT